MKAISSAVLLLLGATSVMGTSTTCTDSAGGSALWYDTICVSNYFNGLNIYTEWNFPFDYYTFYYAGLGPYN